MDINESESIHRGGGALARLDRIDLMSGSGKKIVSILVVDDDDGFLQEIRDEPMLNRTGWVLRTARSASEAYRAMKAARTDIFVVGSRLPDQDGISFLEQTKKFSPNSLRFFAYARDDRSALSRTIGLANKRLEKPVSSSRLAISIRQVLLTHLRIRKPEVAGIVRDTRRLHVNTESMQELLKTADNPECDIDDLAAIIVKHPTAVATVLHIANTAFYGSSGGVDTIEGALQLLGMDFVRNLAITELAKKQLRLNPGLQELANDVLHHSVEVSQYGSRMRQFVKDRKLVRQLCSNALLHDLGKLVLLANKGHEYADLMGQSVDSNTPLCRLERESFGCDHAAVGGFLYAMWGLPEVIVRSVTWHHEPEKVSESEFCPCSLLYFANCAAHANHSVSCYCGDCLDEKFAEKYGLAPDYVLDFEA